MKALKVLISGASIAGPALGYWLCRGGHDVTIVERAPSLRVGGYAVDIRGVALEVVARMGLRERLRPLETDTLSNAVVDARGRRFGRTRRGFGVIDADDVEIGRGDLVQVLFEASAAEGARYRFGDHVVAIDARGEAGDEVEVTFASGARETFDLIVGADGVHSATRALAFAPEVECVRPLGSVMAIFTVPNSLGLVREQLLFNARGKVASVKSADGDAHLKVCVFFSHDVGPSDVEAQRDLVAAAFADAGWEWPRLVADMRAADDFYCDITCQVHVPAYHSGRVALVGDAAYCPSPLSGQGTSLALVGAYVLASALAAEARVEAALTAYDAVVRPFARQNQAIALSIGKGFAPTSDRQVWLRNLAMRMLPYLPWSGLVMKLAMRGVRRAARALTLPPAPVAALSG